ncbi:TonB-dependent receptor plug domain-containing protein [Alishewanella longhuensis]|nr:TonB-dependent receptor [Alishewanella longhuensis]
MKYQAVNKLSKLGLAITLAVSGQAFAQSSTDTNAAEQQIEKIEVTGSRLKGVDMEGANPLQVFSRDDLTRRGYDSISSFLRDLPQASAGTFNEIGGTSGNEGAPAGSAGVSLRGLGSSSTLILVNGRRVAVDSFSNGADTFVNVNAIPMSAIERVEVLTDGASSVYGSDAIAGVINFILRKDVEGHEVSVMYGDDTSSHDFSRKNLTYVGGFATTNSNTTVVIDYFDRNALFNKDRDVEVTFKSNTRVTIDGVDNPEPWCGNDTSNGNTRCRYDYVIQRAIQPETKNFGTTINHYYDLGDNKEFFAEAMYQRNTGFTYDAPAGLDITVPGNAAFVPAWARELNAADGNPDNNIRLRTRFPERRSQSFEAEAYRALAGLRGELGNWGYETAVSYGKSENEIRHVSGYFSRAKVREAVNNGSFNPFNLGRDTPQDVITGMRDEAPRVGDSSVFSADFSLNGELFEMPAGTVQSVFGGEYRREKISDTPSPLAAADGIYSLGASDAAASRDQFALYSELNVPLTEQLDAIVALRYDSYSDFGSDINPKLSLRYRATDSLILRASASTGFRAPSLSQIGAGKSLGFNYISCLPGQPFQSFCGTQPVEVGYDEERVGNKELDAEKSRALNIGMSWNLTDNLQLTADYWRYRHTDIVDYDSITTLRGCLSGAAPVTSTEAALGDAFGCVVVNNELVFLRTGFYNIGSQETDGIDVNLNYRLDTGFGSFKFYAAGTKTFNYKRQLTPDSPKEDLLGRLSGANEIARPDLVADFGTDWRHGDWSASLSAHYISSLGDGDFRFGGNETVKAWTTLSGSLSYDISDAQSVSLAVRNLTDKAPPYASSPTDGYASAVHDWVGRLWTLRYTIRF